MRNLIFLNCYFNFSYKLFYHFNVDDLDNAYAALELYFKSIELAELGKRPPPENSDIGSEVEEKGRGHRDKKTRTLFSPTATPTAPKKKKNESDLSKITTVSCCDKTSGPAGHVGEPSKDSLTVVSVPTPPVNLNIMTSYSCNPKKVIFTLSSISLRLCN